MLFVSFAMLFEMILAAESLSTLFAAIGSLAGVNPLVSG